MDNSLLFNKLAAMPENLKSEVSDFIDFLLSKAGANKKPEKGPTPKFGSAKGFFKIKPGFDEPLEDFKEYMG
jgi:hypothetical protein